MDLTTKNVLNFEEAVEYTGFSHSYLYKLTSAQKIPCYRPYGKMLFFKRVELEEFLTKKNSIKNEN
ncbi:MAG: helix-turn-helix domain-containing protein [Prolixibacteraceae bacterium]|nr:helix-turn-helix domain-containing protein [Prolixibacteraceae bacterium]